MLRELRFPNGGCGQLIKQETMADLEIVEICYENGGVKYRYSQYLHLHARTTISLIDNPERGGGR